MKGETPNNPESQGEAEGGFDEIYEIVRRIAAARLSGHRTGSTFQPTDVANEAVLKVLSAGKGDGQDRDQLVASLATAVRSVLVDRARRAKVRERYMAISGPADSPSAPSPVDLLQLDEALRALVERDARAARIVELRYFGGLTFEAVGTLLGMSARSVEREWAYARAWLSERLGEAS